MNLLLPRRITRGGLLVLAVVAVLFAVRRPLFMAAPACLAGHWHGCYDTENGVLLMTLAGLPLAVLLAWALSSARAVAGRLSASAGAAAAGRIDASRSPAAGRLDARRSPDAGPLGASRSPDAGPLGARPGAGVGVLSRPGGPSAWRRSLAEVGMVYGTVPFVWITLMPGPGAGVVPGRLSLVPLRDLATMGPIGIGGNLLIFAALGFFAPIRFATLASAPRVLALGAACSVLVETAQYVFQLDRVSSVDDVLVNATGALLAALVSRRWWRRAPAGRPGGQPLVATGAGSARGPRDRRGVSGPLGE